MCSYICRAQEKSFELFTLINKLFKQSNHCFFLNTNMVIKKYTSFLASLESNLKMIRKREKK